MNCAIFSRSESGNAFMLMVVPVLHGLTSWPNWEIMTMDAMVCLSFGGNLLAFFAMYDKSSRRERVGAAVGVCGHAIAAIIAPANSGPRSEMVVIPL